MKKKIFGCLAVVSIVVAMAFNVNLNMNMNKSDNASLLALANVESLAGGESYPVGCPENGCGCYNGSWYPYYREAL